MVQSGSNAGGNVAVPLSQMFTVSKYVLTQKVKRVKRYPLVLMLEPLFRCNLACAGCGKIQYPDHVLDKRLTPEQCWSAAEECGAPMVSIPGGEPLIHPEMPEIVRGLVARKKYVYLCTNAILLERKLDEYAPSKYLTFSIHMDGLRQEHLALQPIPPVSGIPDGQTRVSVHALGKPDLQYLRVAEALLLAAGRIHQDVPGAAE